MSMQKALHPRKDIDYMYLVKEEKDSIALSTAEMDRYKDSIKTWKRVKND